MKLWEMIKREESMIKQACQEMNNSKQEQVVLMKEDLVVLQDSKISMINLNSRVVKDKKEDRIHLETYLKNLKISLVQEIKRHEPQRNRSHKKEMTLW